MNTNTNTNVSVEQLAKNIIASVKAGFISNHSKSPEKESWTITNVNDNNKGGIYILNIINSTNKSGNPYNHHEIIRASTNKPVNFGPFKKKLLYTLAYNLQSNNIFKKIKQDPSSVKSILHNIKNFPNNWSLSNNSISGHINNDSFSITRTPHLMKSGKTFYKISATKNGIPFLNGSQLMILFKEYPT